jgi:hypothetical protein
LQQILSLLERFYNAIPLAIGAAMEPIGKKMVKIYHLLYEEK